MEFLTDPSVQRILIIAGGVLGLFGVYFALAVASNRSVRRLADSLRRRQDGRRREVRLEPMSRLFAPHWAILILLSAAGLLVVFFVFTTGAL